MALGDSYVTLPEAKDYLSIPANKTSLDAGLTQALDSVSREIERFCGRQFDQQTSPTARVFEPLTLRYCDVDDFWTTSGLVVQTDSGGTGDFDTLWDAADFELRPFNGVVDGTPGWPYS